MITTDESVKLWEEYEKSRNLETRNELIMTYYPMIKGIVYSLQIRTNSRMDFEDLLSCAVFGLIDAIEKFDSKRNVRFETYACERIRGAVIDDLRKIDWLPRSIRKKLKNLEKASSDFEMNEGRAPDKKELAHILNINSKELDNLLKYKQSAVLLSYEDIEEKSLYCDTMLSRIFESLEAQENIDHILGHLSERERFVVFMHYIKEVPFKSISTTLGLTEARISQIHKRALSKLRTMGVDFV